eukprot:CAMPEP_0170459864 /NCGR_PEP_ID=MMETSP0123-20130129/6407_1 /TAXON_ID=182087 /ORGANISM="Favella ehrenbergii, Strain Fehren 1" /LENGTH=90 /DNA_ID=CAMNT_0010724585 /DNA_START=581 /DNA_END=850 /DNA_ORIENTATION=-
MRSGCYPFQSAKESDEVYSLLAEHMSDLFWMSHEDRLGEGYYSEAFKDMITSLLQSDPAQRPSITDVIAHPWLCEGECATSEQVSVFFEN